MSVFFIHLFIKVLVLVLITSISTSVFIPVRPFTFTDLFHIHLSFSEELGRSVYMILNLNNIHTNLSAPLFQLYASLRTGRQGVLQYGPKTFERILYIRTRTP